MDTLIEARASDTTRTPQADSDRRIRDATTRRRGELGITNVETPRPWLALRPLTAEYLEYQKRRKESEAEYKRQCEIQERDAHWSLLQRQIGSRYSGGADAFQFYGTGEERRRQVLAVESVRRYAGDILNKIAAGTNVVLFGPPGTGKDHLLAHLLSVACQAGARPHWLNGQDFYGEMRDRIGMNQPEGKLIDELARKKVLALSDILPQKDFQTQTLFRLIDRRYRAMLPTWFTLNVANGDEAVLRMGDAIYDRVRDGAVCLFCNWPSWRKPLPAGQV